MSFFSFFSDKEDGIKVTVLNSERAKYKNAIVSAINTGTKRKKDQITYEYHNSRAFVIHFTGDVTVKNIESFREEVLAVSYSATKDDLVIIKLESPGGSVAAYGEAAELIRFLRVEKELQVWVVVDRVAASGGYMMASQASKIIVSNFAVLGSIGVLGAMVNYSTLAEKHGVTLDLFTAGENKVTLHPMKKTTKKDRDHQNEQIAKTHDFFKEWVVSGRSVLKDTINEIATGDIWYGQECLDNHLADEVGSYEKTISDLMDKYTVMEVKFTKKVPVSDKLIGKLAVSISDHLWNFVQTKLHYSKFMM